MIPKQPTASAPPLKIRPLLLHDVLPAARLLSATFNKNARDIRMDMLAHFTQADPDDVFIVAVRGGQVAGAVKCTRMNATHFTITYLAVDAGLRGRGIGQKLVQAAEDNAASRAKGKNAVITLVDATKRLNNPSHFYEDMGYKQTATAPGGLPVMTKTIAASATPEQTTPPPTPQQKPPAP